MHTAGNGKLDCLEYLTAKGANLNAKDVVSGALPTHPPHPHHPSSPPVAPPSPPQLTACGAAAAPS